MNKWIVTAAMALAVPGAKFYCSKATEHDVINLSNDEIIKEWVKILDL